jgi:hypothetical protein
VHLRVTVLRRGLGRVVALLLGLDERVLGIAGGVMRLGRPAPRRLVPRLATFLLLIHVASRGVRSARSDVAVR